MVAAGGSTTTTGGSTTTGGGGTTGGGTGLANSTNSMSGTSKYCLLQHMIIFMQDIIHFVFYRIIYYYH